MSAIVSEESARGSRESLLRVGFRALVQRLLLALNGPETPSAIEWSTWGL